MNTSAHPRPRPCAAFARLLGFTHRAIMESEGAARILATLLLPAFTVLCLAQPAGAQTVFQQNANGQAYDYRPLRDPRFGNFPNNSNWSQVQQLSLAGHITAPSNWNVSTGVAPGAAVVINGNNTTADASYAISSLTLLNGGRVTINGGVTLAASGAVTNNGVIYINGSAMFNSVTNFNMGPGGFGGLMDFFGTATAANASFINNGATAATPINYSPSKIEFYNATTAGNGTFTNNGSTVSVGYGGYIAFLDTSTAGHGTFINKGTTVSNWYGGGGVSVSHNATAGAGNFTNNGGTVNGGSGGNVSINDSATAGTATFTNNGGTVSGAYPGNTFFGGLSGGYTIRASTGGNGTFINNGATVSGATGGYTQFFGTTAGNATLFANGGSNGGQGGNVYFADQADGGTARAIANGNGFLDIRGLSTAGMNIGSIEGNGIVYLGANTLTVGGNNLSTTFSGAIQNSGSGGAFTKAGTGALTLTGTNTYAGATTVNAGALTNSGGSLTTGTIVTSSSGLFTNTGTITLKGSSSTATPNGGTFAQTNTGTLNVQIGGAGSGQFGRIVAGNAILAGKLNVTFVSGFQPGYFDSFKILSTTSLSGTFNNGSNLIQVTVDSVPVPRFFKVIYANDGVTLQQTAVFTAYHQPGDATNRAGHAFLSLTWKNGDTKTWGFYAVNLIGLFGVVPGNGLGTGLGIVANDQGTPWDYKISYPITDVQYDAVATRITQDRSLPPIYSILGFNCMNWVIEMAAAAGVQLPNATYLYPNWVVNGVADPRVFGISLASIGNGNVFIGGGGTVASNPSPVPALHSPAAPVGTPFDYSYSGLESDGHSDPGSLATSIGLAYDSVNLGIVNANSINGLSLNIAGITVTSAIISMKWGDGSALQEQSLAFSHVYAAGTYSAQLLVIDTGAVHSYNMTVVVSGSPASSVNVNVTPFTLVNIPNQGLIPADHVPDFIVVQTMSFSILANGHRLIQFVGIPGLTYTIQGTSDLNQSFLPVGNVTAAADGTFQYDESNAVSASQRFYRATLP